MSIVIPGLNKLAELQRKPLQLSRLSRFADEVEKLSSSLELGGFLPRESNAGVYEQVSHGRKIGVSLVNSVQIKDLQSLNAVCDAESELIDEMHDATLEAVCKRNDRSQQFFASTNLVSTADHIRVLKAAKEAVNKKTEDFIDYNNLVQPMPSARRTRGVWEVWAQAMLEDFFSVCDLPNALELMMLARAINCEIGDVCEWFRHKREENKETRQIKEAISIKAGPRARTRKAAHGLALLGHAEAWRLKTAVLCSSLQNAGFRI